MNRSPFFVGSALAALLTGCAQNSNQMDVQTGANYSKPLAPGASALRLITDESRMPDLRQAYRNADETTLASIKQSLAWFAAPSSQQYFPFENFSHQQARASLIAMHELFSQATTAGRFNAELRRLFDIYESVGYNNHGIVLFTGYYAPVFQASLNRSDRFAYPLYTRPHDLVSDPITAEPIGRRLADGRIVTYPTRQEIEESRMFAGNEFVWLEDALAAYIVHVNGSAKLRLTDGSAMYVGYSGKTDRPYYGLGQSMLDEGLLTGDELSLSAIEDYYDRDPELIKDLINRNESYVFFTEYEGDEWPSGSLGVPVTAQRSLATDKKVYPRAGLVLVDTRAVTLSAGKRDFLEYMCDQDTGGAIKAPGRADIFMGVGPTAEILAGGQYAEGRLYYFFLKPQHVAEYSGSAYVGVQ